MKKLMRKLRFVAAVVVALVAFGEQTAIAEMTAAIGGVQLWENGPYWAECNIGATNQVDFGEIVRFDAASNAVSKALGAPWRVPTNAELWDLVRHCDFVWTTNGVTGCRVTSRSNGKSIFLPAAGCLHGDHRDDIGVRGCYWSSETVSYDDSYGYYLSIGQVAGRVDPHRNWTLRSQAGAAVRAVRNADAYGSTAVTHGPR